MSSKWSYLVCGVNITFAFVGALAHSVVLMSIGAIFAVWNWVVGEAERKVEEQEYGKNSEESK